MKAFTKRAASISLVGLVVFAMMCVGAVAAPATRLKVGATPVPHAEILEAVKPILAAKGTTIYFYRYEISHHLLIHKLDDGRP